MLQFLPLLKAHPRQLTPTSWGYYEEWSDNGYKVFWTFPGVSDLETQVLTIHRRVSFAPGCSWTMNSPVLMLPAPKRSPYLFWTVIGGRQTEQPQHSQVTFVGEIWARSQHWRKPAQAFSSCRLVCTVNHEQYIVKPEFHTGRKVRALQPDNRTLSPSTEHHLGGPEQPLASWTPYLLISNMGIIVLVLYRTLSEPYTW